MAHSPSSSTASSASVAGSNRSGKRPSSSPYVPDCGDLESGNSHRLQVKLRRIDDIVDLTSGYRLTLTPSLLVQLDKDGSDGILASREDGLGKDLARHEDGEVLTWYEDGEVLTLYEDGLGGEESGLGENLTSREDELGEELARCEDGLGEEDEESEGRKSAKKMNAGKQKKSEMLSELKKKIAQRNETDSATPRKRENERFLHKCTKCDFTTKRKHSFNQHLNVHVVGKEPIPCRICGQKFPSPFHLTEHINSEHLARKASKELLAKKKSSFPVDLTGLVIETRLDDGRVSLECKATFYSRRACKDHLYAHSENKKPFPCNVCGHGFSALGRLREHMCVEHPGVELTKTLPRAKQTSSVPTEQQDDEEGMLSCEKCNATFHNKKAFKEHWYVHLDNETPFPCSICRACFSEPSHLRKHIAAEHCVENLRFECPKCSAVFYNSFSFTSHLRVHEQKLPFVCSVCAAAFPLPAKLKEHMDLHLQGKLSRPSVSPSSNIHNPYQGHNAYRRYNILQCEACSQRFSTLSEMKAHRKGTKAEQEWLHSIIDKLYWLCRICNIAYPRHSLFAQHMQQVHNMMSRKNWKSQSVWKCDKCPANFFSCNDSLCLFRNHYRCHREEGQRTPVDEVRQQEQMLRGMDTTVTGTKQEVADEGNCDPDASDSEPSTSPQVWFYDMQKKQTPVDIARQQELMLRGMDTTVTGTKQEAAEEGSWDPDASEPQTSPQVWFYDIQNRDNSSENSAFPSSVVKSENDSHNDIASTSTSQDETANAESFASYCHPASKSFEESESGNQSEADVMQQTVVVKKERESESEADAMPQTQLYDKEENGDDMPGSPVCDMPVSHVGDMPASPTVVHVKTEPEDDMSVFPTTAEQNDNAMQSPVPTQGHEIKHSQAEIQSDITDLFQDCQKPPKSQIVNLVKSRSSKRIEIRKQELKNSKTLKRKRGRPRKAERPKTAQAGSTASAMASQEKSGRLILKVAREKSGRTEDGKGREKEVEEGRVVKGEASQRIVRIDPATSRKILEREKQQLKPQQRQQPKQPKPQQKQQLKPQQRQQPKQLKPQQRQQPKQPKPQQRQYPNPNVQFLFGCQLCQRAFHTMEDFTAHVPSGTVLCMGAGLTGAWVAQLKRRLSDRKKQNRQLDCNHPTFPFLIEGVLMIWSKPAESSAQQNGKRIISQTDPEVLRTYIACKKCAHVFQSWVGFIKHDKVERREALPVLEACAETTTQTATSSSGDIEDSSDPDTSPDQPSDLGPDSFSGATTTTTSFLSMPQTLAATASGGLMYLTLPDSQDARGAGSTSSSSMVMAPGVIPQGYLPFANFGGVNGLANNHNPDENFAVYSDVDVKQEMQDAEYDAAESAAVNEKPEPFDEEECEHDGMNNERCENDGMNNERCENYELNNEHCEHNDMTDEHCENDGTSIEQNFFPHMHRRQSQKSPDVAHTGPSSSEENFVRVKLEPSWSWSDEIEKDYNGNTENGEGEIDADENSMPWTVVLNQEEDEGGDGDGDDGNEMQDDDD